MASDGWSASRIGILLSSIAIVTIVSNKIVLPSTPSIPYHVMLLDDGPGTKGDYVNVEVPGAWIRKDKDRVLLSKRVACVEGEVLRFDNGVHFCGDEALGQVLEQASDGTELSPFKWNGPVPAGKAYIVGTHERSFDSRYFGFVDLAQTRRLQPLF